MAAQPGSLAGLASVGVGRLAWLVKVGKKKELFQQIDHLW